MLDVVGLYTQILSINLPLKWMERRTITFTSFYFENVKYEEKLKVNSVNEHINSLKMFCHVCFMYTSFPSFIQVHLTNKNCIDLCCTAYFDTCIRCSVITTIKLINISTNSQLQFYLYLFVLVEPFERKLEILLHP